jgi:hypothetical protein
MTPKDKAIELVDKFHNQFSETDTCFGVCEDEVKKGTCTGTGHGCYLWKPKAKQCALIAVDEIDKAIDFDWMEVQNLDREHFYWGQVRAEIINL